MQPQKLIGVIAGQARLFSTCLTEQHRYNSMHKVLGAVLVHLCWLLQSCMKLKNSQV
jgi:hypothetical protein